MSKPQGRASHHISHIRDLPFAAPRRAHSAAVEGDRQLTKTRDSGLLEGYLEGKTPRYLELSAAVVGAGMHISIPLAALVCDFDRASLPAGL